MDGQWSSWPICITVRLTVNSPYFHTAIFLTTVSLYCSMTFDCSTFVLFSHANLPYLRTVRSPWSMYLRTVFYRFDSTLVSFPCLLSHRTLVLYLLMADGTRQDTCLVCQQDMSIIWDNVCQFAPRTHDDLAVQGSVTCVFMYQLLCYFTCQSNVNIDSENRVLAELLCGTPTYQSWEHYFA